MSKMGRPKAVHPKDIQLKIRADNQTLEKINYCCEKMNTTKSEIIRIGIEKVYQSLMNNDGKK